MSTTLLAGVTGLIILPFFGRTAPEALVTVLGACIGSLSSFLVSPPRGSIGNGSAEVTELTVTKPAR